MNTKKKVYGAMRALYDFQIPHLGGVVMGKVRVIIGGDVCPTKDDEYYFRIGKAESLFNDLSEDMRSADLRIINLECPLIEQSTPISKIGPILGAKSTCINGLKAAGIDVVCLANNHIFDHGEEGVRNTIQQCHVAGIRTVGVGANISEARKITSYEVNGYRIGILAMAEKEFSLATEKSWGANPIDIIDFIRDAANYRKDFDFIITLIHGGNEHYPYPSPRARKLSHFFIEQGVGAVIWQHSHCPGGVEEYRNGHIVYGQGNLIFNVKMDNIAWHRGYLVDLVLEKQGCAKLNLIPYTQSYGHIGASKMSKEDSAVFLEYINKISTQITDNEFVTTQWEEFCSQQEKWYVGELMGYGRIFNRFNILERLNINKFLLNLLSINQLSILKLSNLINCEAHHEVLVTVLNQCLQKVSK